MPRSRAWASAERRPSRRRPRPLPPRRPEHHTVLFYAGEMKYINMIYTCNKESDERVDTHIHTQEGKMLCYLYVT